jgi:thiosulfate/3-mercaptopyruvate sulfurtransferase
LLPAGQVVLIDARTGPDARQRYQELHLAGARYVDLGRDLAGEVRADGGGRHPLPTAGDFAQLLGQLGIGADTPVVVYDNQGGANAAARFWWMLRAMGHVKVQVLDGGWPAALVAGLPTAAGPEPAAAGVPYATQGWTLPLAGADDVQKAAHSEDGLVIDVREPRRYRGEIEPLDLVAGHIPGAVNVPFADNLDAHGGFLAPAALRRKYQPLFEHRNPAEVIVHCGSGVTACHTLLALAYAGLPLPRLYVGSWSEWSRSARPVATGAA